MLRMFRLLRMATAARTLSLLLMLAAALFGAVAHATSYVYDAEGRLRAATTANGAATEYLYDALGNLVAVNQIPAGTAAIFAFTPGMGPVGTNVTIDGQGFVPGMTVAFNGATTSSSYVSANRITATVPSGATTGLISVQSGSTNATSFDNFVVTNTPAGAAPTVTGFTPAVADSTTAVLVTGTHFAQGTSLVQAGVNSATSFVTPTSDSSLSFTPQPQATTGLVSVTTQFGAGQSAQPLIIVPTTVSASNIMATAVLGVDGSAQSLNITTAGHSGAVAFNGSKGQWLSLQFNAFTSSSGTLGATIYDPLGNVVVAATLATTRWSYHLPVLPMTGWYTIVFAPGAAGTAQIAVRLESNPTVSKTASLNATTTVSTQSKRYVLSATQGESMGLGFTNVSVVGDAYNDVGVTVLAPDGSTWKTGWCQTNGSNCDFNLSNAPATGTYQLVLTPDSYGGTFSMTTWLTDDVAVTLPANTATNLSTTKAGQNGRYSFSGTAGTNATISLTGIATTPAGNNVAFTLLKPDGTALSSCNSGAGNWCTFNQTNLPSTGTYTIYVDPAIPTATMSAQLLLNPTGTLNKGASTAVSTTQNGAYRYYTFSATQGENLGLGLTNVSVVGDQYNDVGVTIYAPDGSTWKSGWCQTNGNGCDMNLSGAPQTGTYTVWFKSDGYGGTFSLTAWLSDDVVVPLPAGSATGLSTTLAGQNGRYTFSGTAGSNVTISLTGIATTPAGNNVAFTLLKPDGTALNSCSSGSGNWCTFNQTNLPSTGTYTIYVDPAIPTATMSAQLLVNPNNVLNKGGSTAIATTQNGEYLYYTFSATQGENMGLALTNLNVVGDQYNDVGVFVYAPDGSQWRSSWCQTNGNGCDINLSNAPQAGTYTVWFKSDSYGGTFSMTAWLTDDAVVPLPTGAATTLNTSMAGQNGRYTFSGTAGNNVTISVIGIGTVPVNNNVAFTLLKPDGTALNSCNSGAGTWCTFNQTNLPSTGTYTLYVDPGVPTANMKAQLMLNPTGTLNKGGSTALATTQNGQYLYSTFSATQGENLGIGMTNMSVVGDQYNDVGMFVYAPDGSLWKSSWCQTNGNGCDMNMSSAPATGTYTVWFKSDSYGGTFSATLWLTDDVSKTLAAGTSTALSTTMAGQNGRYTFSGTAGSNVTISLTGIATTPAGNNVAFTLLKPDGTALNSCSSGSGNWCTFNQPNLPSTGTYTIYVDPGTPTATMSAQLAVTPTNSLNKGGSTAVATTLNGQYVSYSFSATLGENLGLALTNMSVVGDAYNDVGVFVYAPDGSLWKSSWCQANGNGCDLNLSSAPQAGTYTVWFKSDSYGGTFSVTAWLTDDVIVALPSNVITNLSTTKAGQNGRYTFSGTAGTNETIGLSGIATNPANGAVSFAVLKPDGTVLASGSGTSSYTFNLTNLPSTGTYQVWVDPGTPTASLNATKTP